MPARAGQPTNLDEPVRRDRGAVGGNFTASDVIKANV